MKKYLYCMGIILYSSMSFAQSLTVEDLIYTFKITPGKAQEFLSQKKFVYKNEMSESDGGCPISRWVSLAKGQNESIIKSYCYSNSEEDDTYVKYVFVNLDQFNQFVVNVNKLGYRRVDTWSNIDGMNNLYQNLNENNNIEIRLTSQATGEKSNPRFLIKINNKYLTLPFDN